MKTALDAGRDVTVDGVHLPAKLVTTWYDIGHHVHTLNFNVNLNEALARNAARSADERVPDEVITGYDGESRESGGVFSAVR